MTDPRSMTTTITKNQEILRFTQNDGSEKHDNHYNKNQEILRSTQNDGAKKHDNDNHYKKKSRDSSLHSE